MGGSVVGSGGGVVGSTAKRHIIISVQPQQVYQHVNIKVLCIIVIAR